MRMSCNGCRVLRKGCNDDCVIRPCLGWIKSSDSQGNATLFLAKFYGRTGLINLIEAAPLHLRPAVFRSLLYEACGRVVNPVFGAVGSLWSGNWAQCHAAVDAVLKGQPIVPSSCTLDAPPPHSIPPSKTYDIRHVIKAPNSIDHLNKVKNRTRFKRSVAGPKLASTGRVNSGDFGIQPLHEQWFTQRRNGPGSKDEESLFSVETVEGSLVKRAEMDPVWKVNNQVDNSEVSLDLRL